MSGPGEAATTRVDVLLPVYDGAAWIADSVRSILGQTHRDLRLVVVDDGSRDATPAILAGLAAGDARMTVHRIANAGIVGALNHGLARCDAPFLARHDADDIAAPHRLAAQLAYLQANADCVAVGASARHIDARGEPTGTHAALPPPDAADASWLPAREPYLLHPFLMVRRHALAQAGGYRHVVHAEDSDLYWRLRPLGRLHNLDAVLGDYRLHGASVSAGSVQGGRLMAVGSQLAAASALRRERGAPDLPFDAGRVARLKASDSLAAMVERASADLEPAERAPFADRVAAKLLDLADYQPYELEPADCAFIGRSLARCDALPGIAAENRRALRRLATRAAVRLARGGRGHDARVLLPPGLVPAYLARYAWEVGVPAALRSRLHAWTHARAHREAPAA